MNDSVLGAIDAQRRVGWARALSAEAALRDLQAGQEPRWVAAGAELHSDLGMVYLSATDPGDRYSDEPTCEKLAYDWLQVTHAILAPAQARALAGALLATADRADEIRRQTAGCTP